MVKIFVFLGSINAFFAVALGAFGAHALKSKLSREMLTIFDTAVHYHLIHALALILVGIIAGRMNAVVLVQWAGGFLLVGVILFSGSLYILSLSGVRAFGAVTPFGGVSFLIGWIILAIAALKHL